MLWDALYGHHLQQLWGLGLSAAQGPGAHRCPHTPTDPTSHTGCPRHSTALSSSHTGLAQNIGTDSPDPFLLLVWKWLTFTSESTNSRFTGKHMPMDPQSQHGPPSPFYTLFQLFLPSPLPLHFSPTGCILLLTPSPQRPSGLGSCLLQSPGLVAVSWWPLSVAVKVVSCFFSPFSLSVRFVPLFCLLLPLSLVIPFCIEKDFDKWP